MSTMSENERLKLDEKAEKKAKKKAIKKKKEKKITDSRVWNIPKEIKTQFACEFSIHSIGEDYFRLSFFENRTTVGPSKEENQMDCIFRLGVSRRILEKLRNYLNSSLIMK